MFSVSPVEPVVALDVGPVNQAGYDCTDAGTCSAEGFMKIGDIKGEVKPTERVGNAVSYTHLTLPTNREV